MRTDNILTAHRPRRRRAWRLLVTAGLVLGVTLVAASPAQAVDMSKSVDASGTTVTFSAKVPNPGGAKGPIRLTLHENGDWRLFARVYNLTFQPKTVQPKCGLTAGSIETGILRLVFFGAKSKIPPLVSLAIVDVDVKNDSYIKKWFPEIKALGSSANCYVVWS